MFKSYSSKSAAVKGAIRAFGSPMNVQQVDGRWGFYEVEEVAAPQVDADGFEKEVEPDGNIEGTGEESYDYTQVEPDNLPAQPFKQYLEEKSEVAAPVTPVVAPATGLKIEKEREERNGVKRPSAGGTCRAIWDFCDAATAAGAMPTAKDVKGAAEAHGWNPNNASIEYYNWRKFMGIRGRQQAVANS